MATALKTETIRIHIRTRTKTNKNTKKSAKQRNANKTKAQQQKTRREKNASFSLVTPHVGLGQQPPKRRETLLEQQLQVSRGVERIASTTLASGRRMGPAQGCQQLVGHGSRRHGLALGTGGRPRPGHSAGRQSSTPPAHHSKSEGQGLAQHHQAKDTVEHAISNSEG